MLELLVDGHLLLESLHLLPGGSVGADAELSPDHVGDEDAQGLGSSSRGSNGSCVVHIQVGAPVLVSLHLHARQPLQGGHDDAFREQGETGPESPLDALLHASGRLGRELLRHDQRGLLSIVILAQLPYPLGNALHAVLLQQALDPTGEVLGSKNLDVELRVQPPCSSLGGNLITSPGLGIQTFEIIAYLLAAMEVPHPTTQESEREWRAAYKASAEPTRTGPFDIVVQAN